ncbi:MAG: hypothetical protein WB729_05315 [Candidatus Sulfotelmatobacter sp.]
MLFILISSCIAAAQTSGNTGVYNQSSNSAPISYSPAYIDASAIYFWENSQNQTVDFCAVLNNILTSTTLNNGYPPFPAQGAVVDARGILNIPTSNGHGGYSTNPLACSINPFLGITQPTKATILLPAATIAVSRPWVIPSETKVVGAGRNATTLALDSSFVADSLNALIEMGSPGSVSAPGACGTTNVCTGISIEHLTASTNYTNGSTANSFFHAIYNNDAQDASYVDDVVMTAGQTSSTATNGPIVTTGLLIGPGANYSGPYTNIDFVGSKACSGNTCAPTACVQIQAQTRGLHGITCTVTSTQTSGQPRAAIYLDSYNNTISDVHSEGSYDGIVVGDYFDLQPLPGGAAAAPKITATTISNLTIGYGAGPSLQGVHICSPALASSSTTACTHNTSGKVSDVTLTQIQSTGTSNFTTVRPIADDLTGTLLPQSGNQQFVGKYVVGEPVTVNTSVTGYTRYTTSPTLPNWGIGDAPISGACNNPGGIYSHTKGGKQPGTQNTFYVCAYSTTTSSLQWIPIG